jgi:hypothetical protein
MEVGAIPVLSGDFSVNRLFRFAFLLHASAFAAMMVRPVLARDERDRDEQGRHERDHHERDRDDKDHRHRQPVYQRRAFEWAPKYDRQYGPGHDPRWNAPQVSSGWFQRPYPYHLDYYKMRYGGSYAPYFGNLYGPPQVVTAPPYYGPYYGGYEFGDPQAHGANGEVYGPPIEKSGETEVPSATSSNESLPLLPP